jgi:hypothetical protein
MREGGQRNGRIVRPFSRLRAERRLGKMLREVPKHPGGRPGETGSLGEPVFRLTDAGLSKKDSHKFQRLASIPEEVFEDHLAEARSKEDERGKKQDPEPVPDLGDARDRTNWTPFKKVWTSNRPWPGDAAGTTTRRGWAVGPGRRSIRPVRMARLSTMII